MSSIELSDSTFGLKNQTVNVPNAPVSQPQIPIVETPIQVSDPNVPSAYGSYDNAPSISIIGSDGVNPPAATTQQLITPGIIGTQQSGSISVSINTTPAEPATDPNLNNAPVVKATSYDPNSTDNNNPNAKNKEASKDPQKVKDPKSEINKGGQKEHTITKGEIDALEKQTNLTLYPYIFGGELARIKHQFSGLNLNKYYLLLNLLVYGFDNKILQSGAYGQERCVIDQQFLHDFIHMANIPQLQLIIQKTPAGSKGCFKDVGKLGVTQANAQNMNSNPITGPKTEHPGLVSELLERIHPGLVGQIDSYCNQVRTRAYLTLPRVSFSSIQQLIAAINGIIASFQKIIYGIYNGIMYYIQQISGIINGLIAKIQQLLMMFLESIIPVDLLCILMMILKKFLSDSGFFQSIANFENMINKFQNSLIQEVNKVFGPALALANNPFGAVTSHLSPEVNQLISMAFSVAQDPNAFLNGFVANYGYGQAAEQSQQGIVEQFDQIFSPLYSEYSPIGKLIKSRANGSNDTNANANKNLPQSNPSTGPTLFNHQKEDIYGRSLTNPVGVNVAAQGNSGATSSPLQQAVQSASGTPGLPIYNADGTLNYADTIKNAK